MCYNGFYFVTKRLHHLVCLVCRPHLTVVSSLDVQRSACYRAVYHEGRTSDTFGVDHHTGRNLRIDIQHGLHTAFSQFTEIVQSEQFCQVYT